MKYNQAEISEKLKYFFQKEAKHYNIQMAFLYGSWAIDMTKTDSDIDVAVVFEENLIDEDWIFNCITDITLLLMRELHAEVNILPILDDFKKPMLYYNAVIHSIPVFILDFYKFIQLKNMAIYQMEDFCLFGVNWQREITKSNLEDFKNA